jgi:pyrroloquinoline-quinone synthase
VRAEDLTKCPCCGARFKSSDLEDLGDHFYDQALASDAVHVMWLNRNITKTKTGAKDLSKLLANFFEVGEDGLQGWVKRRFVEKFYGPHPHPFVLALQHPSRGTLLGYVVEHQHFLRQWVRSCSFIMARTEATDVILYELDNINTEFGGSLDRPSHYELLLRMSESLGLDRSKVLAMPPLPDTRDTIRLWDSISREDHWVEAIVAMHGLELIANRNLRNDGASMHYFDPAILKTGEVTEATKSFLREGYDADVGHSEEALDLAAKYVGQFGIVVDVQATFMRSIDAFDRYLMARLERGRQFESA